MPHWVFQCLTMACFPPGDKFAVPSCTGSLCWKWTRVGVSQRGGKRQHAEPGCAWQRGVFELCLSQMHSGNKVKFTGMCFGKNFPLHFWVCTCSSVEIGVFTDKTVVLAKFHPPRWQGLKPTFLRSQKSAADCHL